jgi:hypothetical protein
MKLSEDRIWEIAEGVLQYVPMEVGGHRHLANHEEVVRAINQALKENEDLIIKSLFS